MLGGGSEVSRQSATAVRCEGEEKLEKGERKLPPRPATFPRGQEKRKHTRARAKMHVCLGCNMQILLLTLGTLQTGFVCAESTHSSRHSPSFLVHADIQSDKQHYSGTHLVRTWRSLAAPDPRTRLYLLAHRRTFRYFASLGDAEPGADLRHSFGAGLKFPREIVPRLVFRRSRRS